MSRKTLSLAGDGSSVAGLLDDEPIVRELLGWPASLAHKRD
jgi:hypothetical protein